MYYVMLGLGGAAPQYSLYDWFGCVRCSDVEYHYFVFFTNITISALFHRHNYYCYWNVYVHDHSFWTMDSMILTLDIG